VAKTDAGSQADNTPAADRAQADRFDPAAAFTDAAGRVYQPAGLAPRILLPGEPGYEPTAD
jgi:hypothetical protein